jgi:hypothetical protein
MVSVYYDESGEYGPRGKLLNMSIGGCVASDEEWQAFNKAWQSTLEAEGLTQFHMTDFERWTHPFDFKLPDGSRDIERHNRLLNDLLDLMLKHVGYFAGFAAGSPISQERDRAHYLAIESCRPCA